MKNSKAKQIKQKISKINCPIHVKAAMYTAEASKVKQPQDCPITFLEYSNNVTDVLSTSYRYTIDEAKELVQKEMNTLIKLYESIDKDKIDACISSAAYTLDLMWEEKAIDEKYKYYDGNGIYRSDGKNVEFYVGNGKWKVVDFDIDHALRWDDNFMEVTDREILDYLIKDWDDNAE